MKAHSRFETARKFLIFWCLFIGVGAVGGSVGMLTAPDGSNLGMQALLPYFQVLPFADVLFQDFVFPGIALLCVNGLSNLAAAWLLLKRKDAGVILGGSFGVTLMLWICIQFVIFPLNFMSTTYFFFGLAQACTGYAAWVFLKQERFTVDPTDYPNVGTNPREAVVYFSRMGYTRRVAYETANASGAALYELKTAERTAGTLGFWWCGRFGMHGWAMPIEEADAEMAAYDKVTICSPIWVFTPCGPVRRFCELAAGKLQAVEYVFVHFQGFRYEGAAKELDALLGVTHSGFRSLRCRMGTYREL